MKKAVLIILSLFTIASICAFTIDFTGAPGGKNQVYIEQAFADDGGLPFTITQAVYHINYNGTSAYLSNASYMVFAGDMISIIADHSKVINGTTYYFSHWKYTNSTVRRRCIYPTDHMNVKAIYDRTYRPLQQYTPCPNAND